ncbi:hypothetical protein [Budvicia aquatica]|uniref:Uncharacterized protein n=1 Tax=Budvicia aquatica TaxID=82979 RepID=A0A484ZX45_9GAMM|nr:hypothetical protein [Budvicia aquatica]VFS53587.1 Uncharacterised protein [Budvicia aquatica]
MKLTITPTALRVSWALGVLTSVLYGAGAQAVMSSSTGTIMGRHHNHAGHVSAANAGQ